MKTKYLFIASALLLACLSCSKMNDNIEQYLSQGEITYLAKPDSVKLFPGRERFLAHFWVRDPRVSEARIFWSQRRDSLSVPIPEARDKQEPVVVMVDRNIAEGDYTLYFVTYDKYGNHSVSDEHFVNVYGDFFQSTLLPRHVKSKSLKNNALTINWGSSFSLMEYGVRLFYTDLDGKDQVKLVTKEAMGASMVVSNVDSGKEFSFETVYLPEPTAIDTFYTVKTVIPLP